MFISWAALNRFTKYCPQKDDWMAPAKNGCAKLSVDDPVNDCGNYYNPETLVPCTDGRGDGCSNGFEDPCYDETPIKPRKKCNCYKVKD